MITCVQYIARVNVDDSFFKVSCKDISGKANSFLSTRVL
jgi:hypothetical protein